MSLLAKVVSWETGCEEKGLPEMANACCGLKFPD